MYFLSSPRLWTLSIERLFSFLSILNGVALKTSSRKLISNVRQPEVRPFLL